MATQTESFSRGIEASLRRRIKNLKDMLRRTRAEMVQVQLKNKLRKRQGQVKAKTDLLRGLPRKQKIVAETMIKKSMVKPKGMRYSSEFILESVLFSIFSIKSPKGYKHCKTHDLLPLPSKSLLRKLLRGLKCSYGINASAMESISQFIRSQDSVPSSAQGILVFDELKLGEVVEFNSETFKVDGFVNFGEFTSENDQHKLADHALVFMLVPLTANWVQPVAVYAAKNSTPGDILAKITIQVVKQLEEHSAKILGFVCDGSQPNKRLWAQLGISGKLGKVKNSIQHPLDPSRKLFAFSDYVHIFKCIRNHFEKYKLVNYQGTQINYEFYSRLYQEDSKPEHAGLRVIPKLTSAHITPKPFQKMTVRFATQLFSNKVSLGLQFYRKSGKVLFQGSVATEAFTKDMNDFFDALNLKLPIQGLRPGNENHLLLQRLDKLLQVDNNSFASTRTLESMRVTVRSTLEAASYLWELQPRGFRYVLTYKFSQDVLERHFGIIRGLSPDDHPSTTDFLQLHMLQAIYVPVKNMLSKGANCEDSIDLPLTAFTRHIRLLATEKVQQSAALKVELQNRIRKKLSPFIEEESLNPELIEKLGGNAIVRYLCGYLIHRASKFTSCALCLASLQQKCEPVNLCKDSILTDLRDFGTNRNLQFLKRPSESFFRLILQIESVVKEKLMCVSSLWSDVFYDCLDSLSEVTYLNGVGCCEDHIYETVPKIILFYIRCRFFFRMKEISQELKVSSSAKQARKMSKVVSSNE